MILLTRNARCRHDHPNCSMALRAVRSAYSGWRLRLPFLLRSSSALFPWFLALLYSAIAACSNAGDKFGRLRVYTPGGGSQPRERPQS